MLVGLGAAAKLVTANLPEYTEHMAEMRNYLREQLIRKFQLVSGEDGGPLKAREVRSSMKVKILNICECAGVLANGRQSDIAEYTQCKIWGLHGSTALAEMSRRHRGMIYILIVAPDLKYRVVF